MYFNRKNAEQKNWRMIKKGKHFLFGCSLVFAIGAALATPTVQADTAEAKVDAAVGTAQAEPNAEGPTYAAPAATSPVATEAVEANSATTVVSVDKTQLEAVLAQAKAKSLENQEASVKAEVEAAIAEAEALVAKGSASQVEINQSVDRLTQALVSIKEVTEVDTEATPESSATPKVRSRRATTEGTTRSIDETNLARAIVTKDNFESFFQEGGTASYDKSTGTIKLTDDVSGQVGSAYLRFKINSGEAFTFTGKVDIGNKYEGHVEPGLKEGYKVSVTSTGATDPSVNPVKAGDKVVTGKAEPGSSVEITLPYGTKLSGQADKYGNFSIPVRDRPGGDGVGFVFHTGKVDTIGQSGASIGMGTIKNAFGFKLDSWHNTSNPNANQNASADPKYGGRAWESNAFGSFYSSNNAGKVTTSSSAAKALNPAPSGQWVDFKIEYDKEKNFTVTYGSQTWTTNLSKANTSIMTFDAKRALTTGNPTFALSFLGSTGSGTNLQRVQIERFEFTAPQIVHMKFVDAKGNEIEASSAIPGDENEVINLSTQDSKIAAVEAKGYKLKRIDASKAPSYNEGNNTVTLTPGGQLLTYVFAPAGPTVTPTLQVGGVMTEPGIKSTDNTISGIGKKGATIKIAAAGKTIVDNVTVAEDGSWSATLPSGVNSNITEQDQLVPRDTLTVTQTINGEESAETEVKVGLGESVVQPSESSSDKQSLVAETTTVTLKVPHDAGITYFDYPKAGNARSEVAIKRDSIPGAWTSKDESKAVVKSYSTDGFFDTIVLEMKEQIQPGKAKVVSNIKEGKYTSPVNWKEINVEAKPADVTAPDAPTVNPVKAGATAITGTAEAGSTVEVTLQNGQKASAKAGENGEFSIPVPALNADDQISVIATDAAKNTSTPTKVTVKETVRPTLHIPYDDPATQAIYVYSGEENNIELKVTDNSGKIVKAYLALPQDNRSGLGAEDTTFLNGRTKGGLYLKTEGIHVETTATESTPAIVRVTGEVPKNTYTESSGQITRYLFAEDTAGNTGYEHVGDATTPGQLGRIRFMWKPQTFKYTAVAPSTPITSNTVPDASAIEKAVKDANPTFSDKIESVSVDGTNVKVTYKDGSTDVIPADSVFTIEPTAPTVTPVKNPSSLTQPEKDAVKKAVETANPSATKVEVGTDGTTTLTYSNGSTATLKPGQTVKAADANGAKAPATKTPVKDTANLTEDEKAAVKKAVETANPSATKVEVGQDGTTTVTFPDGSEATLKPAQTVVKAEDAAGIKEPATKTPVKDTANLTEDEKAAVKKAVETANPSATKVEVGQDGTTTVTFPDGSEATLKPAQTVVKAEDAAGIKEPATKTPVKDTANLTEDEKAAVKKAVETANPSATKVEVGQDGTTTVTFPDGSEATLKPAQTVVKAEDAAGIKEPATKTPVKDTANLTEDEKAAVKKAVETANPSATKVEVGQDGTTTVTFPDGSEATLKPAQTVVKAEDAAGIKEPATKTPVKDTANLTEDEKAAVKKAVETANPSATKVEVGQDGTTTVTFPDGSEATLKPAQTVVKAEDAAGIKEPATKTPVKDTANLTEDEKAAVKKAVETANPSATKVEVGQDGTTTVTFPDGSEATLKPAQTVVKAEDAAGIKEPATKTPVKDTANLTEDEKAAVKKAVETANPSATKVEVGQDGTTTVTFPDGSEATLKPAQTVVKAEDAAGIKEPATKTPVKDTANLTEDEKAAVKKAVETANPSATKVEVGQDGTTTVTFPDGSEATLKPAQTVVKAEDAAGIKEPATKTPVKDTANLTEDEKAAVKKAVETANPSATKVEVGQDGTTTVTFPDGSEATLKPAQTVVKAEDAAGIKEPATKTPVKDTANLTEDEKAAVKKAVETANPSATKVEVGQDGTTTVTFPDGSEATLKPAQTVVKAEDAAGIKEPATKTPVKDTANLTEDEKAAVKKAVETANPSATKVEVGQDGTTTVTFPDGSEATLKPAQTVVKAEDAAGIKEPATKTPVKDTANLTEDEKAAVKKAVETANPSATKVEVGQDGTTTVTFPDGSEATLKPAQTVVKAEDAAGIKEPATKTPVKDTANLTEDEKAAVKKAVETANPSATKVEVGQDGTTTVTFPDGSEATLKPAQTVVKAEDAAGIKEPATKTPVKDTANLTEDEKAAVKKAVETANPSATKVEVGQDGTTTVTFPDGSEATLKPAQTVAKAAPAAPDVNPVKASDKVVTGKAEPGSSVEVTLPDGTKKSATAGEDGTFSIPVDGLKEGDKVSVTATDAEGNKSGATDATVAKAAPAAPVVNDVKEGDKAVTGTAEPGSIVEITLPNSETVTVATNEAGLFYLPIMGLKAGDKVTAVAKDASGNTSTPTEKTVGEGDAKEIKTPVVNPVKAGDTAITGTAEAGSTVEVTLPDGTKATATADKDGKFSIPVDGLKEGDKVSVTATDAAGNKSGATDATVAKAAPVVNPVKAGDKVVTGKAEPGSSVEVTLPDGIKATATADKDGKFSIPVAGLKAGDKVSVTATDAAGNKSGATDATVAPAAPVVNPVKAGDTAVTGTAEAGSTVEVTLPDGTKATATADKDGKFSIPVAGLKAGDKVSVTATDAAGNKSGATDATVAPAAPVVNPVKAGDTAVTGTAEAGSTVEVTLPDGTKATATADKDGKFSIPVAGLKAGDKVSVTATDAAGNKSGATDVTVAPAAPVVNPVKAGDTAVTGTAEAGSTVEVTLPDGTKATATADKDGKFSIPVAGLKAGDKVSVTATDAAGNKSGATDATVAPAAPVVNPVKAGDTAVTGTAEAGSTVEVTLPDGTKATATADKDGKFSIPVAGLKAGDKVSVTATDAAGNKSGATDATVAPAAPVVNPVKAGDTAVTGTAEAGSTVEVTLPDGTKATATADKDGKFSIPVAGLKAGDKVSVTATDAAGNKSGATDATVAPAAPVVNPVKAGDTAVTGTAEAGSTVEVTLPDGTKATATADKDGKFSIPVAGLKAGDKVSVTATDAAGNKSGATDVTVAPAAPVVNPVKAGDTAVTGTAEAGSTVEVTLPDGTKATATADKDGKFSIPVAGLKAGDKVSVTATDAAGNKSGATDATVAPAAPVVNPVKAGDTAVTGTAEAGSTVEVTLPDGTKATATADKDGKFSIPVAGLKAGDKVSVTATDAAGNKSGATDATVAPAAPVVNPVKAGDTAVTGTAEAGSTVEVTLPDGTKATATADKDGKFSIPVDGLKAGDKVSVTATDAAGNKSGATDATVAPAAPVVNPVKAGDTAVTGTAEAGSTVEVTLPDGTKATATADKDGKFSIPVAGLKAGDKVSVTATDAAGNKSGATDATVAPAAPVVNPVKAGDTAVTGTAEAGSTVEVTLPDGTKATATADKDGKFSIPVAGLKAGDKVSVTATDAAGNKSGATDVTVAPAAPVVNPVKAGDTAVTGTAEAGSTVEVTLPDGTKATATADKDGKFSIPVAGLKAGDKVSVTATDAAGNKSGATDATVAKATPTAPSANDGKVSEANGAKAPALTPVVDPSNLTDAEKAKIAEEVKKANPTATDIKVNNDGSVVVTFADGSVAVIATEKAVKKATKESSAKETTKKAGAKELPNTGTEQSNVSLGLALLAAVTGGLLISKKRKEEE